MKWVKNSNANNQRRLIGMSLVIFASLANDTAAQGSIFYEHFPATTPHVFPWDSEGYRLVGDPADPRSYQLDLNHDAIPDFQFTSGDSFSVVPYGSNAVLSVRTGSPLDFGGYAVTLSSTQQISANSLSYEWLMRTENPLGPIGSTFCIARDIAVLGFFAELVSGYAGLRFEVNGQFHYGWIRVGAPLAGLNGGWLYDYAFETRADTPIQVGAVPEPSVMALVIVTCGLMFFWRDLTQLGRC